MGPREKPLCVPTMKAARVHVFLEIAIAGLPHLPLPDPSYTAQSGYAHAWRVPAAGFESLSKYKPALIRGILFGKEQELTSEG